MEGSYVSGSVSTRRAVRVASMGNSTTSARSVGRSTGWITQTDGVVLRPTSDVTELDTVRLIAHVETAVNLDANFSGYFHKGLVDVDARLGAGLYKEQTVLPGKHLSFLCRHRSSMANVRLVCDEHDNHVWVPVRSAVLQPRVQVIERVASCHVVHQQSTSRSPIVTPSDASKALLPSLRGGYRRLVHRHARSFR